jgi:hypothetical protein
MKRGLDSQAAILSHLAGYPAGFGTFFNKRLPKVHWADPSPSLDKSIAII